MKRNNLAIIRWAKQLKGEKENQSCFECLKFNSPCLQQQVHHRQEDKMSQCS